MRISRFPSFPKSFNGHRYTCDSAYTTKNEARARAARLRQEGYLTRLHPTMAGGVKIYEVYKRK